MEIPVELSQILINEAIDQQIIVLKEKDGERSFPIVIGMPEILAIDRRLKGFQLPRPLTHELVVNVVEKMGGKILKVVVNDLNEHTFFARIHVQKDSEVIEIDSRPSDAIAISAGLTIPLFVEDRVFDQLQM